MYRADFFGVGASRVVPVSAAVLLRDRVAFLTGVVLRQASYSANKRTQLEERHIPLRSGLGSTFSSS
jgi:hypothetical protein